MKSGVADCIIIANGNAYAIELKRPKGESGEPPGYLSASQKDWREKFLSAGGNFRLCRSLEEVSLALQEWSISVRERDGL